MEFYGDHQEAREVLSEYAYNSKFPTNPNAHVYFYQFLKRHGASKKSLVSALKVYIQPVVICVTWWSDSSVVFCYSIYLTFLFVESRGLEES